MYRYAALFRPGEYQNQKKINILKGQSHEQYSSVNLNFSAFPTNFKKEYFLQKFCWQDSPVVKNPVSTIPNRIWNLLKLLPFISKSSI